MQAFGNYDFLNFEDDFHLLEFKFANSDFHIWMFSRTYVLQYLISSKYKQDYPLTDSPKLTKKKYFSYIINTLKGFHFLFKRFDFLYFGKTAGCTQKIDNKWFNRVNDYFATKTSKSLVLDHSLHYEFKKPRFPQYTASQDLPKILTDILGKIFSLVSNNDEKNIQQFIDYLNTKEKFDPNFNSFLKLFLRRTSLRIRYGEFIYKTIFKMVSPRILFIEDASYGVESYLIKWAKDLNIKVAEIQHGMVSPLYPAYCYGETLSKNIAPAYLPDFYLTYGEYWGRVVKYPSKIVPIGNPHFDYSKENSPKKLAPDKSILIVADACNPKKFSEITIFLAKELSEEWKISLKVHPLDSKNASKRYPDVSNNSRVEVITDGDIFHYLTRHQICITSFSTTLFEALALGVKTLIFNDDITNAHIPHYIGKRFSSNEELIVALSEGKDVADASDDIFKKNWSDNFDDFLKSAAGSSI